MPSAPPSVPRCSRLATAVGKLWLRACGWTLEPVDPPGPKFVMIAAPHTSNWDVVFMIASTWGLGLRISWIGKHTLFTFPKGLFMRWTGGIPVDRSRRNNLVAEVVELFQRREALILAVSPEGTRGETDHWRSGFYHIAKQAGVPLALGCLDYGTKTASIKAFLQPTGDLRADMDFIRATYQGARGKRAGKETVPRLRDEGPTPPAA